MTEEHKKLVEMVDKGVPDKEIMKELGIKTKASLTKMYYDALVEAGKIKPLLTERELKKAESKKKTLTITNKGRLIINKPLLIDELGFKEGDTFEVAKRKDSIILKMH
jgi:predicted transcriptional regulator